MSFKYERKINYYETDKMGIVHLISEYNGIRMTIKYNVIEKNTKNIVIEACTKHCFTDRNLKPINMKKKNIEIYNEFEELFSK